MFKSIFNCCFRQFYKSFSHSADENYEKTIITLNSLQTNKQELAKSQGIQIPKEKLTKLNDFLLKCGLDIKELEKKLSVIHISGTKGKGSTCAFCESILRNYGFKTGFFSSPHLVTVRERIRINGYPISQKKFSDCFWTIYKKLKDNQILENEHSSMPTYFMFLTIMALKIFKEEKVDIAIIEVGIGGEYDYTNLLSNTAVVGISSLGYDHVEILGNTIEEIAWNKAGIMKPGAIAITSEHQCTAALNILQRRAIEKNCSLYVAPSLNKHNANGNVIELGIKGPAQTRNASLAVQLVNAWLNPQNYRTKAHEMKTAPFLQLSNEMLNGLSVCRWPGRTQVFRYSPSLTYYFDGAHTLESLQYCLLWFKENELKNCPNFKKGLIFNVTGSRNAEQLMTFFVPCEFDFVFFCANKMLKTNNDCMNLKTDEAEEFEKITEYREKWLKMNKFSNDINTNVFRNVNAAHEVVSHLSSEYRLHVLVTGSLHLVGAYLGLLDPELK